MLGQTLQSQTMHFTQDKEMAQFSTRTMRIKVRICGQNMWCQCGELKTWTKKSTNKWKRTSINAGTWVAANEHELEWQWINSGSVDRICQYGGRTCIEAGTLAAANAQGLEWQKIGRCNTGVTHAVRACLASGPVSHLKGI